MNFQDAVKSGFKNWLNFSDRASRSEFWYWFLFSLLLSISAGMVISILGLPGDDLLENLLLVVLFIPNLSIAVRRLHDIDKSGWWYLIIFIPLIGFFIWLYWACVQGTNGPNRFGADPLRFEIL